MASTKYQVVIQLDVDNVQKTTVRLRGGRDAQWEKLNKVINQRLPSDKEKYSASAFGIVLQIKNEDTHLLSDAEHLES